MFGLRDRTLSVLNTVAAIIAAIVAILSLPSVSTKELTLTYFAKRELVTLAPTGGVDLEVQLNGTRVQSPWLLSARLENTGSQPVVHDDIEEPVRLAFASGKVLSARIVQRSRELLAGETEVSDKSVVIRTGLLNHGDWLNFDIIFDGEPDSNLDVSASIRGVNLKKVPIQSDTTKKYLTIVPLPLPVVWLLLVICTFAVLISVVAGVVILARELARIGAAARARAARDLSAESANASAAADELSATPRTSEGGTANQILQALGGSVDKRLIDNPPLLSKRISDMRLEGLLASLGIDADRAAEMLSIALKQSSRDDIGERLSLHMAPDLARRTRRAIRSIDVRQISTRELYDRVRDAVAAISDSMPPTPVVDREGVRLGFLLLIIGIFLLLLLGGTWRTVFA